MLHIGVWKFGLLLNDPTARYTTVIEDGTRTRWTKLAAPQRNPATNSRAPASQPTRKLKTPVPLLPPEIILEILEAGVEPFEHQAVFVTPWMYIEPQTEKGKCPASRIGVYKRRNWRDIPMFSLSRSYRQQAIRIYGLPQRDTFPFNKVVDTLTVNLDEDATFLTGSPAKSSVISRNVQQVTAISLHGINYIFHRQGNSIGFWSQDNDFCCSGKLHPSQDSPRKGTCCTRTDRHTAAAEGADICLTCLRIAAVQWYH